MGDSGFDPIFLGEKYLFGLKTRKLSTLIFGTKTGNRTSLLPCCCVDLALANQATVIDPDPDPDPDHHDAPIPPCPNGATALDPSDQPLGKTQLLFTPTALT